jgi:SAM-dependent MidA family methyltransferase
LTSALTARIVKDGPIPFPEFMATALYDPELGYYARETRQVGRGGDFFTSVSVGPVFGGLLARRFLQWWRSAGKPSEWRILELGGHDGTLAADVLASLQATDPAAFQRLEYVILEPLPTLAAAQRAKLSAFSEHVRIHEDATSLPARPGIAFGNELLDALPFHVIEWQQGQWTECHVGLSDGGFGWLPGKMPSAEVAFALKGLPGPFAEGYRSEVRTCCHCLLESLANALGEGLLLWIDYGFARPDYYSEARTNGTLRTFHRHQAGDDPLAEPGLCDITAHVDFTHVAETAISLGMTPSCFSDQGSWLTRLAADWLRGMENQPDPAAIRQFQTLVHPSHLRLHHRKRLSLSPPIRLRHLPRLRPLHRPFLHRQKRHLRPQPPLRTRRLSPLRPLHQLRLRLGHHGPRHLLHRLLRNQLMDR